MKHQIKIIMEYEEQEEMDLWAASHPLIQAFSR